MIDDFEIAKAFIDKLDSISDLSGIPIVASNDESYEPQVGVPYLRESILRSPEVPFGYSKDTTMIQDGIYQVDVCTPKGEGKWRNLNICGKIKAAFPRKVNISSTLGKSLTVLSCDVGPSRNENDFYVTYISIHYKVLSERI